MRGKELLAADDLQTLRITPACAGKSNSTLIPVPPFQDHPHVCGEKVTVIRSQTINEGSPPPVRGKDTGGGLNLPVAGITPACAGKRLTCINDSAFREDHPRVCGEKLPMLAKESLSGGSPPRVRGKVSAGKILLHDGGITPAHAGKRRPVGCSGPLPWDHPRMCGEKFHPASDRKLGRVRGTKRSSGPAPAAAPAGLAGSCPASPPWSYPPRITVSRPRP